ncbi:hypothetical protein CROQUDRAFT_726082 [Cronartium quercuum f. sp. fusiforme G11]|uniref:Uncharacterized protein n=1 Tax=Cronartium quercuum f. sp. fusiforme G11 TaxID=708437 RepID=A0A9P6NB90_9BASI|nr:hypothetical protein CROQUDRAFT_726082 [Cronartium quercuum f. sp. fusiforme G11]
MTDSNASTLAYSVLPGLQFLSVVSPLGLLFRRPSIVGYFRWNGLLTFGIGGSLGIANVTLRPLPRMEESAERVRLNDFSIIGAALGGLATSAIFAHRGFWQVLTMAPGGASLGIAGGFLTGIVKRQPSQTTESKDE